MAAPLPVRIASAVAALLVTWLVLPATSVPNAPFTALPRRSRPSNQTVQDLIAKIAEIDDQLVPPGMVNVRVGLLLPYSQDDSPLIRDLTIAGTSAIRLAFAEVNIQQELLPGAWITVIAQDSFGLIPNSSLPRTHPSAATSIYATLALDQADVSAIIGDATSKRSLFSALITSKLSLPQCSFSAGSSELSKKDQYSTFFRTVPPDRTFANVMIDVIADRGWRRFGILHSADILGEQIAAAAAERGRSIGLVILRIQRYESDKPDMRTSLQSMIDANVRIILLGATGPEQTDILKAAAEMNMTGKYGFVWVVVNDIVDSLRPEFPDTFNETWKGILMVDNLLRLDGNLEYETFMDKWAGLNPVIYPMAGRRSISNNEGMAYSCAMVLARGFASFVKNASDPNAVLRSLGAGRARANFTLDSWNTGFTGPAGPMVFDSQGDVTDGNFRILNVQDGEGQEVGTRIEGELKWQSPPRFYDGLVTPPSDLPPSVNIGMMWNSIEAPILILAVTLPMVCCIVVGGIILKYRQIRLFKVASPAFCIIELGGLLFAYAWIFLQVGEPTLGICISRPLAIVAAYVLVLGGIVVKNQRIYHIFDNVYGSTSVKIVVTDAVLARVCGTLFLVDTCLVGLMMSLDLPSPTRVQITMMKHLVVCKKPSSTSSLLFEILLITFNVGILGYATLLSYKTRNVAGMYSECKQIALCVYNVFLCTVVAAQSRILVANETLTGFYLPVLSAWVAATFTLVVLFGPKLWQFHRLRATSRLYAMRPTSHVLPSMVDQPWAGYPPNNKLQEDDGECLLDFGFGVGLDIDGQSYQRSLDADSGHTEYPYPLLGKSEKRFAIQAYEGVLPMKRRFKIIPLLSLFTSWEMKKVIVIPALRYCIIVGTDERASTISYVAVQAIRRPGLASGQSTWHGFKATGRGPWHDYVFQVQSSESLRAWLRRFDPTSLSPANSTSSASASAPEYPAKSGNSRVPDKRWRWPDGGQIAKSRSVVSNVTRVTHSRSQGHTLTPTIIRPNAPQP